MPSGGGARSGDVDASKRLVLENKVVRFEFDAIDMGLCAIVDRESGFNHLQSTEGKHLLWQLALARGTQIEPVTNTYKLCERVTIQTLPDGMQRVTMHWKDMRWWLEDKVLSVAVRIDLPVDSGIARWHIAVENLSDYWGLWTVDFPVVPGFPQSGHYDIAHPTFGSGGHLRKGCTDPVTGVHPSGSWSMQFAALNADQNGVYVGTTDSDGRGKRFVFEPGIGTRVVHYPENMGVAGSDYPDYYSTELGTFQGTWVDAAKYYRTWAIGQKWLRRGRLSQREDVPDIIKNVGLWLTEGFVWHPEPGQAPEGLGYITHHGAIEMPTDSNASYLEVGRSMGVPMALHWYNWHHSKFNHDFPCFLPPRSPQFKDRVGQLVDAGWLVMPYINGVSVDLDLPDFKRFASSALTDQGGGYDMGFYGDSAGRLLQMCPTQRIWQEAIYQQARGLYESYGVNGVYVDQVSAVAFRPCFNAAHGHPVGGGRAWTDGYRQLLEGLKSIPAGTNRPLVIASESMNEMYLDNVDANLTWADPTDLEIPLMGVVYSGFTLFFASPCDYSKSIRYFRYAQGQALMDGRQNGWMDIGLFQAQHRTKSEYFQKCGVYRVAGKKFLTYGELLGPVEPDRPIPTMEDDGFGWGESRHRGSVPAAQGRLWRSDDGHLGIILANYVDEPITFSFRLDPARYGLKSDSYSLDEIRPSETIRLTQGAGVLRRQQSLGPGAIMLLEVAPQT